MSTDGLLQGWCDIALLSFARLVSKWEETVAAAMNILCACMFGGKKK